MPKSSVPGPDTQCGRVLRVIKEAGSRGIHLRDIMLKSKLPIGPKSVVRVQSAVHALREKNLRIDLEGGMYIFKGQGISYTQFAPGKDPVPVARGNKFKRVKGQRRALGKSSPLVGRVAPKASAPSAPPSAFCDKHRAMFEVQGNGRTLFKVDKHALSRALLTLPATHREGLEAFAKKAEAYNAAFDLYLKTEDTLRNMLGDSSA